MSYREAVLGWHDFYLTAGAAAATLAGLLFVGLALHLRAVADHPDVKGLARVTLSNFFVVLLVALMILIPTSDPRETDGNPSSKDHVRSPASGIAQSIRSS